MRPLVPVLRLAPHAAWIALALAGTACGSNDGGGASAPDAGEATDGGSSAFCATRPALEFCEDFDEGPLPARFSSVDVVGGGLSINDADPASPPSSLLATVRAAASSVGRARVVRAFSAGTKIRLFVQMREQQRSRRAKASVNVLGVGVSGDDSYEVGIGTDETGAWYGYQRTRGPAGEVVARFPATGALAADRWVSVRIDIDIAAAGAATMTVRFGNDPVVDAVTIAPPALRVEPLVLLGLDRAEAPHDGWGFRYDNATFQID